jgi:hypothetical protein
MSRQYRHVPEILGLIERGDFAAECSEEFSDLVTDLADHAGAKGKAKGKITIEIDVTVEGRTISLAGSYKVKKPARYKSETHFWKTDEGAIVTEDPRQQSLFPQAVTERASS